MLIAIRVGLSAIVGVIVTLGLFYLMQYLIQGADSALTDDKIGNLVDFVRVKQEQSPRGCQSCHLSTHYQHLE